MQFATPRTLRATAEDGTIDELHGVTMMRGRVASVAGDTIALRIDQAGAILRSGREATPGAASGYRTVTFVRDADAAVREGRTNAGRTVTVIVLVTAVIVGVPALIWLFTGELGTPDPRS